MQPAGILAEVAFKAGDEELVYALDLLDPFMRAPAAVKPALHGLGHAPYEVVVQKERPQLAVGKLAAAPFPQCL